MFPNQHSFQLQSSFFIRYVSCILGCPYSNDVAPTSVADVSLRLLEMGCYEISLGDTIGVGTADKTKNLLKLLKHAGGEWILLSIPIC